MGIRPSSEQHFVDLSAEPIVQCAFRFHIRGIEILCFELASSSSKLSACGWASLSSPLSTPLFGNFRWSIVFPLLLASFPWCCVS